MEKVGFIGLGTMGRPMAWNIHKAGYRLGVYNRSAAKADEFRQQGITVYRSASELTRESDIIIIMVFDPQALDDVLQGEAGLCDGLQTRSLVINMSKVMSNEC